MSKKQIRVTNPEKDILSHINKTVNLIMKDNTVLLGTILSVDQGTVIFQNQRLKKMRIPLSTVLEYFTDVDA